MNNVIKFAQVYIKVRKIDIFFYFALYIIFIFPVGYNFTTMVTNICFPISHIIRSVSSGVRQIQDNEETRQTSDI